MKSIWRRWLSVFMAVLLVVQLLPTAAFAVSDDKIVSAGDREEETPLSEPQSDDTGIVYEGEDLGNSGKKEYHAEDVLWENKELRDTGTKYFHLSDGIDVAILYEQPVHYLDGHGVFQDIDNTLKLVKREKEQNKLADSDAEIDRGTVPTDGTSIAAEDPESVEDAGNEYRNQAGLVDVRLAELSNASDLVVLSDGRNTLRFTPAWEIEKRSAVLLKPEAPYEKDSFEAAVTPQNLTAGLRYEEVLPGVDLEYWVHPSGIKENIVLREPREDASFSFMLDCGELEPHREDDGSILFCDHKGESIMCIPVGYMLDAKGEYSNGLSYALEDRGEGKYLLTICADNDWLKDAERDYPVSIDPAVTVAAYNYNNGLSSNYVSSNQTSPSGTHQILYCGYDYNSYLRRTVEYRVMLGFDQLPNLPANCMVVRSTLTLHQPNTGYSGGGKDYYIHQVDMARPSGCSTYASWINNNLVWSHTAGTNISSEVLDYISASHSTANVDFNCDVTRAVKRWYSDPSVSHAFCVRRSETTSGLAWLAIQGYAPSYHVGPALSVFYRNTVGIEDYFSYQSHSIDRAGTGYIGDYTGQLTLVKTDAASASTVCPVSISHVYNSAYCAGQIGSAAPGASGYANMCIGQGWKLNIQQSVSVDTTDYLQYMDSDGTIHYFYKTGTNTYKDEDGLNLTITSSGTNYTMTDRYDNIQYFTDGLLSYSQDANGNRITYVRDSANRVTSVTRTLNGSNAETVATLTYSGSYLSTITDSANQTTSFTYSGGVLTGITHADGTTVSYSYDSSGRLLTAKDNESSYSMTYTYDSQSLISSFTEKAGSTAGASVTAAGASGVRTYRYCGKDRVLNSADDLITSCVFDYFGRTVSSGTRSSDSKLIYSAAASAYSTNSGTSSSNNRLLVDSGVGMRPVGSTGGYSFTSNNLLTNGDMSGSSGWSGANYVSDSTFGRAIQITGAASTANSVSQTVAVNTEGTQTYILSGWAKAGSVALTSDNRSFEIRATITYSDNTTEVHKSPFCADSTAWQYNVLPIVPKQPSKTVSTITVAFAFDSNPNTAFFTYACLTKEVAQSYKYNDNGDLISVATPSNETQTYSYSGADLISQVTKGNGTFDYTYDSHHNVTGVTNAGLSMSLTYDAKGNATASTLTGGSLSMGSSATYTNEGNLIASQTDTRGKTTNYTYDNAISKQLGQPTAVTDPNSVTVNTSYNTSNGRVTGSSMSGVSLGYTYGSGRLTAMTRTVGSAGQTYNMAYDGFGKLTAVQVGTRSLAGYTYAANDGLLTQMTYGNGNTVAYDYDDLERVKNIYYNNSSSPAYTYTYKGEGTLGQLTDNTNNRTYAYTYDSLGRLNGLTEQFGGVSVQTFSASYDTANRPTNVTYAVSPSWNGMLGSNRVYSYTYSASDGSLTSMTGPGASMAYTYDGLKRLMKRVVSSGSSEVVTRNYSYLAGSGSNTSPLVSGLTANHGSTNLFSGNYSYDSVGNITAITGSAPASYTYDSQNQLLTEVRGGTTYTYTYDAAGNLLSKTKLSGSGTDTFTYGNAEWRDLLTAYNGNAITYDTVGNPTTWYDGAAMTWVNGKRLASISATNSHSALAFTYDVDGLRLTKTVGTGSGAVEHKYTWQGGKLIAEYDGTNTLEFFYDESGAPYALSYNGTIYYYITNLQGDVVKIVNASGEIQAEYSYNAWGQVISAAGTLAAINPIRYRGYYYDKESGLYYLKSRYYDPQICRFINADGMASTGQGFLGTNMFAYCGNDPVNRLDSTGQDWWHWGVAAIAVTALVAASIVTCGGAAAAAMAASAIVTGTCSAVSTTAAVITGAAVGSSIALATTTIIASENSNSLKEFADYGETALINTTAGGFIGSVAGYSNATNLCFVAGTLVQTKDGTKPIEEIDVGDQVWAWDKETGEVALKPVLETYINETDELIHVFVNGEEIISTPRHPFYSPVKGWTDAVHLRAGDILVLVNGEYVVVEKIQHELLEAPIHVYNFQVEGFHTYYVSSSGVLVHNLCKTVGSGHGNAVHKGRIDEMIKQLESSGRYTEIYGNRALKTAGLNGKLRPDIIAKTVNGSFEFWEFASPSQASGIGLKALQMKMDTIISENPGITRHFVPW